MTTRKYRFDPQRGVLSPIAMRHDPAPSSAASPSSSPSFVGRVVRWVIIVAALAGSAVVFSLARGEIAADAR